MFSQSCGQAFRFRSSGADKGGIRFSKTQCLRMFTLTRKVGLISISSGSCTKCGVTQHSGFGPQAQTYPSAFREMIHS
jgi:hypothetical protein